MTVAEAQKLVTMFPHVRGSGVGHSWSTGQFCSGNDSSAINIVMTELQNVLSFIENPVDPAKWQNQAVPADFPIHVDEENQTVTVAAGIPQRELLDYLSSYTHWKQPSGWTLPAFSWFIDQTIGGAVSTGTHGSSMRWGSLSSQVRGLKVILANGTLLELKNPEENPHLWRALGVMVGRLGIITELTMRIIPQKAVKRSLDSVNYKQFAAQIQATQRDYVAAKNANNYTAVQDALFQLDNTQALWQYGLNLVWRVDYQFLGHEPQNVLPNIDSVSPNVHAMEGPSMNDVFSQVSWLACLNASFLQSVQKQVSIAGRKTLSNFCFYFYLDGAATSRASTSKFGFDQKPSILGKLLHADDPRIRYSRDVRDIQGISYHV